MSSLPPTMHGAAIIPAASKQDALDIGMQGAYELWPPSDGWTCHDVVLKALDPSAVDGLARDYGYEVKK